MPQFPGFARKVKKLASQHILGIKHNLITGRRLSKFKKLYRLKGELGQGGFGLVYKGTRIADDLPVAVKFIERQHVREWEKLNDERVPMEISMLARCVDVPGVITLLDWHILPEGILIVMERPVPCIDLFDFVHAHGTLDEDLARHFFQQIIQTTINCMERRVLHRDLKDENVVIDLLTGEIRLIDFGAATLLKQTCYQDFQGTRLYCPPEWFLHSLYFAKEAATWSLGVLLYNMLNGRLPFLNEKDICTAHLLGPLPFFASGLSSEVRNLLTRCLAFDPYSRIPLDTILEHPWFSAKQNCPTLSWADLCHRAKFSLEIETVVPKFRANKKSVLNESSEENSDNSEELRVVVDADEVSALTRRMQTLSTSNEIDWTKFRADRNRDKNAGLNKSRDEKHDSAIGFDPGKLGIAGEQQKQIYERPKQRHCLSKSSRTESGIDVFEAELDEIGNDIGSVGVADTAEHLNLNSSSCPAFLSGSSTSGSRSFAFSSPSISFGSLSFNDPDDEDYAENENNLWNECEQRNYRFQRQNAIVMNIKTKIGRYRRNGFGNAKSIPSEPEKVCQQLKHKPTSLGTSANMDVNVNINNTTNEPFSVIYNFPGAEPIGTKSVRTTRRACNGHAPNKVPVCRRNAKTSLMTSSIQQ